MASPKKFEACIIVVLLTCYNLLSVSCKKLSFKESLTAFSDYSKSGEVNQSDLLKSGTDTKPHKPWSINSVAIEENRPLPFNEAADTKHSSAHVPETLHKSSTSQQKPQAEKLSLWQITKNVLLPFQKNESNTSRLKYSHSRSYHDTVKYNISFFGNSQNESLSQSGATKETSPTALKNFLTVVKNGFQDGQNGHGPVKLEDLQKNETDDQQQRSKKDVGNSGIRDVLWSTANALWSVNKEHFLPTFLHTKTGGKLSLIRDSLFKPIAILSQFRSGIREINNEKWRNLAHSTSSEGTHGWSKPNSQVFVVKYQPEKSPLLTLGRYAYRLSKHTVVTKWRLKRALLDLQFRALKKILRIIANKSISQKFATVKILGNAIWQGKKAFFYAITGRNNDQFSNEHDNGFYKGNSNSTLNVDITYPSYNNNNNNPHSGWHSFSPSYGPPPASNAQNFYSLYNTPKHNAKYNSPAPRHTNYVSPPSPEPLIEAPSYAHVLKTMGINPNLNKFDDQTSTVNSVQTSKPTVVYFSSVDKLKPQSSFESNPVIEKPANSFSNYYSDPHHKVDPPAIARKPHQTRNFRESIGDFSPSDTTPSPFRLKLLEAMLS